MQKTVSLRVRLFVLVLSPLVLMAVLLGYWRFTAAQKTADELFDRTLLSASLAISRDVAVSGGDALLPLTRDLIQDASGGEVFYHVTGPGGIYVTGYAYPPVLSQESNHDPYEPFYAEATYRGEKVRVLRLTERVVVENLTGDTIVTVWQRMADREVLANQLAIRAAGVMGVLIATLALVIWFGVALGLRPLTDLQEAIATRSPDDLSQIKRPVPIEAQGIVSTLNRLFGKVESSINAHQVFISDAAHQLKNPTAAVYSMAEAIKEAPTEDEQKQRIDELVSAARATARITDQLLSLDRLQQSELNKSSEEIDLNQLLREICADIGPSILSRGVNFELRAPDQSVLVSADHLFMAEAIKNLIDNALKHAGEKLSKINVELAFNGKSAEVTVSDDGKGLSPDQKETAFGRFSQVEPSDGSGLGLAIAASVAERHGGMLSINTVDDGASLTLSIPRNR